MPPGAAGGVADRGTPRDLGRAGAASAASASASASASAAPATAAAASASASATSTPATATTPATAAAATAAPASTSAPAAAVATATATGAAAGSASTGAPAAARAFAATATAFLDGRHFRGHLDGRLHIVAHRWKPGSRRLWNGIDGNLWSGGSAGVRLQRRTGLGRAVHDGRRLHAEADAL